MVSKFSLQRCFFLPVINSGELTAFGWEPDEKYGHGEAPEDGASLTVKLAFRRGIQRRKTEEAATKAKAR